MLATNRCREPMHHTVLNTMKIKVKFISEKAIRFDFLPSSATRNDADKSCRRSASIRSEWGNRMAPSAGHAGAVDMRQHLKDGRQR